MRDKLKNEEYWGAIIHELEKLMQQRYEKLRNGMISLDRINIVKQNMIWSYLRIINSKYSLGLALQECISDLIAAINLTYVSWDGDSTKFVDNKGIVQDRYYMDTYEQMLWMLSWGYLLNISDHEFKKLVDVIDRDRVRNSLYEYIIRAKMPDREAIKGGDYEKVWRLFAKLRHAIIEPDKAEATRLVKYFVTRDWYKEHRSSGWYNEHLSPHNIYTGYWSYETAAVVKIMGLDDRSFRDCKYYPADLVHYADIEEPDNESQKRPRTIE